MGILKTSLYTLLFRGFFIKVTLYKILCMKVNILRDHPFYGKGVVEVSEARGEYLIRAKIAKKVERKAKDDDTDKEVILGDPAPDITELPKEKKEFTPEVEKVEVKAPGKKKK